VDDGVVCTGEGAAEVAATDGVGSAAEGAGAIVVAGAVADGVCPEGSRLPPALFCSAAKAAPAPPVSTTTAVVA
jgi:hypothetical protein